MKKIIYTACLLIPLPLILPVLFVRYGEWKGNFERQEMEYSDSRKFPSVKVFRGKEPEFDLNENDYDGIHSISFCREWGDRENPVTIVRVVRR